MGLNRRDFIYNGLTIGSGLILSQLPTELLAAQGIEKLTILHTNDQHSRIDPFPMDGGRYQGLGGFAQRAKVIDRIRREEEHVLLFDSGDIFQGTPYFNEFGGELEYKLMTEMGYDAVTLGNHDFDAGLEGLDAQIPSAGFQILCGNYDFSDTLLDGKTVNFHIFKTGTIVVGVFGLGIELSGLVPQKLYGNTKYLDPIPVAERLAKQLKYDHNCDLIICLSHLGFQYQSDRVSDCVLASNSSAIDIILGGHTHTFLDTPVVVSNSKGVEVTVSQVGWAGIVLGRMDLYFSREKRNKRILGRSEIIG